jgi:hypothetical protein
VSWFFSPIFTAIAAAFFFFCIRFLVGEPGGQAGREGGNSMTGIHYVTSLPYPQGCTLKCHTDGMEPVLAGCMACCQEPYHRSCPFPCFLMPATHLPYSHTRTCLPSLPRPRRCFAARTRSSCPSGCSPPLCCSPSSSASTVSDELAGCTLHIVCYVCMSTMVMHCIPVSQRWP